MFEMLNVVEEYSGFFAAFGVLSLSYIALRALYTVWRGLKSYLLSRLIGLGVDVKFLGEWAGNRTSYGHFGPKTLRTLDTSAPVW